MAVALGVGIGMLPLIGLQTWIALGAASLLRLPKWKVWAATYVANPWTVVPILSLEHWIGSRILRPGETPGGIRWGELLRGSFERAFAGLGPPDAVALLVGGLVLAAGAGLLSLLLLRAMPIRRAVPAD